MSIIETDKAYIAGTYNRFPIEIVSGKGSVLVGSDGREYIDMGSGIGVTAFGISDNAWVRAVAEQASTLQHTSNLYYTKPAADLAKALCLKTGYSKVFFSNSGAEANECAIKVARKYAADNKGSDFNVIVTVQNSFHGRTITTLAATGQEHYHELFGPLTAGFVYTPANDIAALQKIVSENKVAAIMFECIQGEGGVKNLDRAYLSAVAALAEANNILLIADEVQTGNGRTGKLYAYMHYGITPDIVTTAKGLGGGLPIGATLMSEKCSGVLGHGDHGSTYGGNPVACAGALTVINRIDEKLLDEINAKSDYIFSELASASGVENLSGMGLMIGIKTRKPAAEVVRACMDKGVLCLTAKDKVRLLPALNIPMELLERAISVIKESL